VERRGTQRIKRRDCCEVIERGRRHDGVVMDLAPEGLFVLTRLALHPGERVELELPEQDDAPAMTLRAIVVRQRLRALGETSRLISIGVGLRILSAPDAYYAIAAPGGAPHGDEEDTVKTLRRFRMRIAEKTGTAFRMVTVLSANAESAVREMSEDLDPAWKVLEVLPD
jgi:hypothetical protein